MSKAVEKALRNNYDNVFTTVIPRLAEAAINTYEQRSLVSLSHSRFGSAYTSVANELIDICERNNRK